jgi:transposase
MSESLAQVAGIDISKDHLDVHLHPSGATRQVTNDKAGHKALLRWFSRLRVERIVFEATGPYHRLFEPALTRAKPRSDCAKSRRKWQPSTGSALSWSRRTRRLLSGS